MACCTYINARKDFFIFSEIFDNLEPENMNFGIYLTRPITNLTLLIHFHETMAWIIYNWMHSRPICNHAHPISTSCLGRIFI